MCQFSGRRRRSRGPGGAATGSGRAPPPAALVASRNQPSFQGSRKRSSTREVPSSRRAGIRTDCVSRQDAAEHPDLGRGRPRSARGRPSRRRARRPCSRRDRVDDLHLQSRTGRAGGDEAHLLERRPDAHRGLSRSSLPELERRAVAAVPEVEGVVACHDLCAAGEGPPRGTCLEPTVGNLRVARSRTTAGTAVSPDRDRPRRGRPRPSSLRSVSEKGAATSATGSQARTWRTDR